MVTEPQHRRGYAGKRHLLIRSRIWAPTQSRSQRKAAFLQAAEDMYERLEGWYDAHPAATFEELEQELRAAASGTDGGCAGHAHRGARQWLPGQCAGACPQCRQPLAFEGYRPWTVKGLEGDSVLDRAYYVCPACAGQTWPCSIRNRRCELIIGVAEPPTWRHAWVCRPSPLIWRLKGSAMRWAGRSR